MQILKFQKSKCPKHIQLSKESRFHSKGLPCHISFSLPFFLLISLYLRRSLAKCSYSCPALQRIVHMWKIIPFFDPCNVHSMSEIVISECEMQRTGNIYTIVSVLIFYLLQELRVLSIFKSIHRAHRVLRREVGIHQRSDNSYGHPSLLYQLTPWGLPKRSFSNCTCHELTFVLRFLASAQHSAGREVEPRAAVTGAFLFTFCLG